jgi:hypothetical protein
MIARLTAAPMGSRLLLVWLAAALLLSGALPAWAQSEACALAPRLSAGIRARVAPGPGAANNLRETPGLSGAVIGKIEPGTLFHVLDEARCADGYYWWLIDLGDRQGWTAEGSPTAGRYWLEPLSLPVDPALDVLSLCQPPPDDYTRLEVNYARLNARTAAMLDHATSIFHALGGRLDIVFAGAIMQGSYNPGGIAASFGTHDGGGAVDLSVREPVTRRILDEDIPLMLRALRAAGFAAWLRAADELHPGSPIHIHAIAIGDRELSPAAQAQIDGPFGYLRGYNGLPQTSGVPLPDTSGDLIVCPWMEALGLRDMRESME